MTATTNHTAEQVITQPGVYDLDDATYHHDPVPGGSLSSTGARKLLPPSCPALFKHWTDNPQPPKKAFDFGHAAHKLVLGSGPDLVRIDADDWRTKAAQQQRVEAYANGAVPLLEHEYQQVQDMADAIRQHPIAGQLFQPDRGKAEQSLFWQDQITGIWCRARLDWLPTEVPGQRMVIPDYKSTISAAPDQLAKAVHNYGYHQQDDWYRDAVLSLRLTASEPAFVFVFQEKTAPYLVTVTQLDTDARMWGGVLNAKARDTYAECVRTGRWPGYADDVITTPLPVYAERQYDDARTRGDFDLTTDHAEGIRR